MRPGYMTAHQAAHTLGITLGGLRQLVRRGHLHHAPGSSPRQPWYDSTAVLALHQQRQHSNAA